jgi:phage gpG-like protein
MGSVNKIPDFMAMAEQLKRDARIYAEVTGETFFKDSFHNQGFTDEAFEAWPDRSNGDLSYKILTVTGALLRSTRVMQSSEQQIVFGSDMPYAKLHNEGGTILVNVTPKMRKYFWFMFRATEQQKYKWMALTKKKQLQITIPKRQFIGESATLMGLLDRWAINEITNRFKELKA